MSVSICWFRRDLRLADNPAWAAATAADEVLPLFVLEPDLLDRAGRFRRDQLLANLISLETEVADAGFTLHVRRGPAQRVLPVVVSEAAADVVHANADVTPFAVERDHACASAMGVPLEQHWGNHVQPPGAVLTQKGTLSKVFTPFYKRWIQTPIEPVADPTTATPRSLPGAVEIPAPSSTPPLPPGTDGAHERLERFLDVVDDYPDLRDVPSLRGTSELSADLKFGTIGPREVLDAVGTGSPGREAFVRQLAWRDWYAHLLSELPTLPENAVRPEYDGIRWENDPLEIDAWRHGQTGYPIVDAGMRQLRETGWVHNRVRMLVASFLVKDLLVDWRIGERWFRHLLVDGDVPQNAGNWQWAAGTGPDAAPYFRIFNPVTQSRKFDPDGRYLRRWVPELAQLDNKTIHAPWEAGPLDLAAAGVVLGDTYPGPIVDHADARERCLAAYKAALG